MFVFAPNGFAKSQQISDNMAGEFLVQVIRVI